jgi:hypothetical protein
LRDADVVRPDPAALINERCVSVGHEWQDRRRPGRHCPPPCERGRAPSPCRLRLTTGGSGRPLGVGLGLPQPEAVSDQRRPAV